MIERDVIDLLEAGDIDALLAYHRGIYGEAVMSDAGAPSGDTTASPEGTDADADGDEDEDEEQSEADKRVAKLSAENKKWRERFQAEKARNAELEEAAGKGATAEDKLSRAEQRAIEAEARATRREVALEHGLTTADARFLDGLTDEDLMNDLAARLAQPVRRTKADDDDEDRPAAKRVGVKGSTNGRRGGSTPSADEVGRAFFGV